ncbi:MAG TPA: 16S rRNA (guanine(527)-N(7))-methyltransferase RsmG [Mycobacteriales bacterium]|nr:16S rRNA (guanine(527)-N(7))-methyltransferase RsmG [Mycobacteriales bacterium]
MSQPVTARAPLVAAQVFGARLDLAGRYADLLSTDGIARGLLGPREADVVWERHLLNCAVVGELIPVGASVLDVGSGAGLPGLPLALARPDLRVTLLEPLERRVRFLGEVVDALALSDQVTVARGRAEERPVPPADVVTARAVAPLPRLAGWTAPLVATGGAVLALRGARAAEELREAATELARAKLVADVQVCGGTLLDVPTTVVRLRRST